MHLTRSCIGFLIQGSISLLVSGREGEKRAAGDGGRAAQGTGRGFASGSVPRSFYPPPPHPLPKRASQNFCYFAAGSGWAAGRRGGSQVRGDSGDSSGSPPKASASSRHCTPGLGGGHLLPFVRPSSAPHRALRTPGMAANSCSAPGAGIAPEHRCIPLPRPERWGCSICIPLGRMLCLAPTCLLGAHLPEAMGQPPAPICTWMGSVMPYQVPSCR